LSGGSIHGAVALLLLLACCSRSSTSDAPRLDGSAPATPVPAASAANEPGVTGNAGPILTPEDVEPETEHRITEQNLESELDRLEREIQAE
jgi:hypothetical protein